jgi:hypothetical protein
MVRLSQALTTLARGPLSLAVVLAAAALAHLPSLGNGFVWDDHHFILANPVLRDAGNAAALFANPETWGTGSRNPYYRPVTMLAFMSDTLLWGRNAAGFHATNVLLHLGTCALLLAVLRRLLAPAAALVAALLFAVHPAHAEPVAYVSARGDLLCGLFLLAAFLAWLRYAESGGRGALACSALAYGAALFSKIAAGLFPAVFALCALLCFRRRLRARDLLPFAAVAVGYLAVRTAVLDVNTWEGPPLAIRAATAGPVIVHYLRMAVSPTHLSVFHDLSPRAAFDATAAACWAAIAAAAAVAAAAARRAPRLVVGCAWFLAGIVPVSGLVTALYPAPAADRYLYVPLIGAALAVGTAVERLSGRWQEAPRRCFAAAAAACALLAIGAGTMARGRLWRDSVTLWERAAREAPGRQYVRNGLGWAYWSTGRFDDAERTLRGSLALDEASPDAHVLLAGLGLVRGDLDGAERHALRTLALDPGSALAYRYLSAVLLAKGNGALALTAAERALGLNPFDEKTALLVAGLRRDGAGGPAAR